MAPCALRTPVSQTSPTDVFATGGTARCMARGDTQEAALAHANEAIQLWIDTARELGDPVPEPKGERLMLA